MQVVILGAGGHGRVVLDILRSAGVYVPAAFLDANTALAGTSIGSVPVLGSVNQLPRLAQQKIRHAVVAIGDSRVRQSYAALVEDAGMELVTAVHSNASVSPSARVGKNVVIAAGAVVCADVTIGDSTIINSSAVVDHECEIGRGVHVCPGAVLAGRVRVGDGAFIGLGSRIIQCLGVGEDAIVGAGAVVLNDVPAGATVVGMPARVVRTFTRAAG